MVSSDANKTLWYLPRLRASSVQVREIPSSAHFLFYDNPVETFEALGELVHTPISLAHGANSPESSVH
jgi:hypothetical protein